MSHSASVRVRVVWRFAAWWKSATGNAGGCFSFAHRLCLRQWQPCLGVLHVFCPLKFSPGVICSLFSTSLCVCVAGGAIVVPSQGLTRCGCPGPSRPKAPFELSCLFLRCIPVSSRSSHFFCGSASPSYSYTAMSKTETSLFCFSLKLW